MPRQQQKIFISDIVPSNKKRVIKVKKYFMWAGFMIMVLTLIITSLMGFYSDYFYCRNVVDFELKDIKAPPTPGTSVLKDPEEYARYLDAKLMCNSVRSNIYISYMVIIICLSMIVAGYITRE